LNGAFYKLEVYVPVDHADRLKTALAGAGAGRWGGYDCCMWETAGTGQFRPLEGSNPFIGTPGAIEQVAEKKLEMLVAGDALAQVLVALRANHPYETPAFYYWEVKIS